MVTDRIEKSTEVHELDQVESTSAEGMTVEQVLSSLEIPEQSDYHGRIERLGGLTNRVYRLGDHVLRLPGPGTAAYVDRADEGVAASEAARIGVSPALVYFNCRSGVMVTEFVHDAETMNPAAFRNRADALDRAAQVLCHLH